MKKIFALEILILFGGDVSRYKAVVTPKTGFSLSDYSKEFGLLSGKVAPNQRD